MSVRNKATAEKSLICDVCGLSGTSDMVNMTSWLYPDVQTHLCVNCFMEYLYKEATTNEPPASRDHSHSRYEIREDEY